MEFRSEHRKAMCTERETQECYVGTRTGTGTRIRTGTGTGTKLKTAILRSVLVIPSLSAELNSGNLGSRCEAVIAVLQGLMSSEVELVQGV